MVDERHIRERSFAFVQKQFDCFPWLTKALTAADIRRAHETGTHAGLVSSQVMLGPWRDLDTLLYGRTTPACGCASSPTTT